jgi:hypothetical protein
MIPEHTYSLSTFTVANSEYDGYEFTVGDEDQTKQAAIESIESLIDDIGYDAFRKGFIEDYIDEDSVADDARENYNYWVYDSPESYLDEKDRELSESQEEEIDEYQRKIDKYTSFREKATERQETYDPDSRECKAIEKGIDKLTDLISDLEYDIENIKEEPDGEWDEGRMEEVIDQYVEEARRDPLGYLKDLGVEKYDNYINKDELIEGVIDEDGYYHTLNGYDGTGDTVEWDGEIYHIMNTNRS